jgi:hypothetical protein
MSNKKSEQLGIHQGTAQHRLLKDILWSLVVKTGQQNCCRCGEHMSRNSFSIDHIEPWLDSDNPVDKFFDLDNISFSHKSCNIAAARKPLKWEDRDAYHEHTKAKDAKRKRDTYTTEKRREKYLRTKTKGRDVPLEPYKPQEALA